jgi:SAM-dependent methyltransferase
MDYQQVIENLRTAYNATSAQQRDQESKQDWKLAERQAFVELLLSEGKQTLLEVGAGTGTDSVAFQKSGLRVICTDLSPAMVELCRTKGLEAYVMDFLGLDFPPASFDAIYAMNCLLHVPSNDLPAVLAKLQSLLRPGGLFFYGVYGVYGDHEEEGVHAGDWHNPPRFFAHHTEAFLRQAVAPFFALVSFKTIPLTQSDWQFQAMVLRRTSAREER